VRRFVSDVVLLSVTVLALIHGLPAQEITHPSTSNAPLSSGTSADRKEGTNVSADDSQDQRNDHTLLRRGLDDQRQIYAAPFRPKNLKWDLLFVAGTGALIAFDRHISAQIPASGAHVSQVISDVGLYSTTASVAGLWLFGMKKSDSRARETGVLALESFANTAGVLALTQAAAGRERPTEENRDGRFWHNNALGSSFPSGHSAFTWTMATVIAHEYPKPWVQWLSYGTALAVSTTRVTGLKHYSADVAVGSAFGYLIGRQIFNSHCAPGLSPKCNRHPREKHAVE